MKLGDVVNEYIDLFLTFVRVGSLTFGGGIAMLPMLEKEVVEKKSWASNDELLDYFAIGQCTPGIIAVNVATFIGYKQKGIGGGIIATLGMITPSLVIILGIAFFLEPYLNIPLVQSAFAGIRVGAAVIILNAIVGLWKNEVKGLFSIFLVAISFIMITFFKISPVYVVLLDLLLGVIKTKYKKENES